jgi:Leucine-rich repeat (LRR) protein
VIMEHIRDKKQSSFCELEGKRLYIYGDAEINLEKLVHAYEVYAQNISIDKLCNNINKLKKLPLFKTLSLGNNNITTLHQINKLIHLVNMKSLHITNNPICQLKTLLRPYCIITLTQLTHFQGIKITMEERENAENMFGLRNAILRATFRKCNHFKPTRPFQISQQAMDCASVYMDNLLHQAFTIDKKMKLINENWDKVVEKIIAATLEKINGEEKDS